jgi:hypothetical protein
MKPEDIKSLLHDLQAICAKHQVSLGGCGCCDSPFIKDAQGEVILGCVNVGPEEFRAYLKDYFDPVDDPDFVYPDNDDCELPNLITNTRDPFWPREK